ncbi:MAG: GNAT family N-acetyltransferase [Thermoguttaceae bacterium]|nr:GNAT family N-acetyltransferase [Thermoguttaceae bacterium]
MSAVSPEAFRVRPERLLTPRLELVPLSRDELALYLTDVAAFARATRLASAPDEPNSETRAALNWLFDESLKYDARQEIWSACWAILLREENELVAAVAFKGPADDAGFVEIWYETTPLRRNRGYMTEALGAFVEWAKSRDDVRGILLETENWNVASKRVAAKNGFIFHKATPDSVFWRVAFR